jgi:hypothetical protein
MFTPHAFRPILFCVVTAFLAAPLRAAVAPPNPLPNHPGHIFLEGEPVSLPLPNRADNTCTVVDYDGKPIPAAIDESGVVSLGRLPIGYYELRPGNARVTFGVIAALTAPTPATSPIGIDVAMAWFYKEDQMPAVANLCALAGVNWVRDRLSWGEVERQKGQFAPDTRYDHSARIQSAAGLRVLQVNHSSPRWANPNGKRFPLDLRDAYDFYRAMAQRWKGQVLAFEPWNEADIDMFGGHTGSEMAAMQKASYLGLKAGNPDLIACLNVFAVNRKPTLDDLEANQAWPYFDTCNLHHYIPADRYPVWYASFRAISAGRPLWVTEFSMPLPWSGDDSAKELSDADLRNQSERLPIVFATSLHEGPQAAFYFMFPHYVEGKTQFGIVHKDLAPRPAYIALAAAGRLLADAKPIGKLMDDAIHGYLFHARPDGQECEVMVAWARSKARDFALPRKAVAVFDHLGRPMPVPQAGLTIAKAPVYIILPAGSSESLSLDPAPAQPQRQLARPSPIVLQALLPQSQVVLAQSAYRISSQQPQTIPLYLYNFSDQPAKGALTLAAPDAWKPDLPQSVEIGPGQRRQIPLTLDCQGQGEKSIQPITLRGDFGPLGQSILSLRLQPMAAP